MKKVHVETSIISFVASRPGRNLQSAALQQQARDWWERIRPRFELVVSQLVVSEAAQGDPAAAVERGKLLAGIPLVVIDAAVEMLAARMLVKRVMPESAAVDALHVAAAAVAGVDYLLTLNCTHIANAEELPGVYDLLRKEGYGQLLICTPAGFLGELQNE